MGRRVLNVLLGVLALGLLVILMASDRGISRLMEDCGSFISNALGV
jgi:hypothetical protein